MKRYSDCLFEDSGDCSACALSSHGRDCHDNPCHPLAFVRTRAGLTQAQLAEKVDKTVMYISKIENDRRSINNIAVETAIKIADACGCEVRELLK